VHVLATQHTCVHHLPKQTDSNITNLKPLQKTFLFYQQPRRTL